MKIHDCVQIKLICCTSQVKLKSNPTLFSNWSKTQILVNHIKITSLFYYIQTIRLHSFICKSHNNGQDPK